MIIEQKYQAAEQYMSIEMIGHVDLITSAHYHGRWITLDTGEVLPIDLRQYLIARELSELWREQQEAIERSNFGLISHLLDKEHPTDEENALIEDYAYFIGA